MAFEAILDEVDQLHNVGTRLEGTGGASSARVRSTHNHRRNRSQHCYCIGSADSDKAAQR